MGSRKGHLIADIAARLRRVCGHMPDDEFDAMVAEIAAVTLKYESYRHPGDPVRTAATGTGASHAADETDEH